MKQLTFYSGLTLVTISFIACVVSFYLLVFGIPTFLVGTILIFLSKQTIKTKLFSILIPLILYVPSTYIFLYVYNYSTPKNILIPKEFDGTLRVVYEEKCGKNYDNREGLKTLTFPKNGILILNEDFDRHINYNYYFIDETGNRTKIPQILNFKDRAQNQPCVLVGGSGTIGQTIEINSTNQEEKGIKYSEFYVYNKATIDQKDFEIQQRFDSVTTAIVNQCRQQK